VLIGTGLMAMAEILDWVKTPGAEEAREVMSP